MKITVLLHEADVGPRTAGYVLWPMCAAWRAAGHEVDVRHGVSEPIDGDLVFLHIDLTRVPEEYLAAVAAHPRVINREVVDIGKAAVSRVRVTGPAETDGPVIVKTELNHGGTPERDLARRGAVGRLRDWLAKRGQLPLWAADWLAPDAYPIFASARDVPVLVWRNPSLIVERFVPERKGELYGLRSYTFLGDRWHGELYWSPEPIVKRRVSVAWEDIGVPEALVELRREMGFDYGKFDYVERDGEPLLLDVNRTPSFGLNQARQDRQGAMLAEGIGAFAS
jgi:hypothetical protein